MQVPVFYCASLEFYLVGVAIIAFVFSAAENKS